MMLNNMEVLKEVSLQKSDNIRVIVSGGGTGGHIFPAIAIANAIKKLEPKAEILFVGAIGRMEMEKVPAAGYKIEGLWISGIQRRLTVDNLSFPLKVLSSLVKSRKIIRNFKPCAVVGVGGYASGPLLYAASQMNIPALIQEQNSYAGVTNKLLAKRVNKICVAYEGMERFFPEEKIMITGNPVRQDILELSGKRNEALAYFGLQADKKTVLVIGGSGGARTINESIKGDLQKIIDSGAQLIWQTGKFYYEQVKKAVDDLNHPSIKAFDFISKMDLAYAAADVVISRAGASSVSELTFVQKPAILVPSPNVAEDHQTKNAMALVNKHAALLVRDVDAREMLVNTVLELMSDTGKCNELSENIGKLALKNSAEIIAKEVLAMCN